MLGIAVRTWTFALSQLQKGFAQAPLSPWFVKFPVIDRKMANHRTESKK